MQMIDEATPAPEKGPIVAKTESLASKRGGFLQANVVSVTSWPLVSTTDQKAKK